MKTFNLLIYLLVVFLLACNNTNRTPQHLPKTQEVKRIWSEALKLAGEPEDFGQRSVFFNWIFQDSKKQFPFALSVSLLTLSIERSVQFGKAKNMFLLKKDIKYYKKRMQEMNQDMFAKTYFAYELSKIMSFGEAQNLELDDKMRAILNSVQPIFEPLELVHEANSNSSKLSSKQLDSSFDQFVRWEHEFLFQPQISKLHSELGKIFGLSLKNIPNQFLEKIFLDPVLNIRSTLSLGCFPNKKTRLRTKNFIDASQRVNQAKEFYEIIKSIGFDPGMHCYNDSYFVSYFEKEFFTETDSYLA